MVEASFNGRGGSLEESEAAGGEVVVDVTHVVVITAVDLVLVVTLVVAITAHHLVLVLVHVTVVAISAIDGVLVKVLLGSSSLGSGLGGSLGSSLLGGLVMRSLVMHGSLVMERSLVASVRLLFVVRLVSEVVVGLVLVVLIVSVVSAILVMTLVLVMAVIVVTVPVVLLDVGVVGLTVVVRVVEVLLLVDGLVVVEIVVGVHIFVVVRLVMDGFVVLVDSFVVDGLMVIDRLVMDGSVMVEGLVGTLMVRNLMMAVGGLMTVGIVMDWLMVRGFMVESLMDNLVMLGGNVSIVVGVEVDLGVSVERLVMMADLPVLLGDVGDLVMDDLVGVVGLLGPVVVGGAVVLSIERLVVDGFVVNWLVVIVDMLVPLVNGSLVMGLVVAVVVMDGGLLMVAEVSVLVAEHLAVVLVADGVDSLVNGVHGLVVCLLIVVEFLLMYGDVVSGLVMCVVVGVVGSLMVEILLPGGGDSSDGGDSEGSHSLRVCLKRCKLIL